MSAYPTVDEAHAASAEWCAKIGVDAGTSQGEMIERVFACGWIVGVMRGTDAAADIAAKVAGEILAGLR